MLRRGDRIAVIGGGYTGTAFAIHLSRTAPSPLDIVVVEPRESVGGGLAHSDVDPEHRLNAPDGVHLLYPDAEHHFRQWLEASGRLAADPAAWYTDGRLYPRRGDFGAYLTAEFDVHSNVNPSGSSLTHVHSTATGIELSEGTFRIRLARGESIVANQCVLAVGQEMAPAPLPSTVRSGLGSRLIENPLSPRACARVGSDEVVLVLGAGLTSADAVASLLGQGHRGPITCISRHGLRPQDQNPMPSAGKLWERLAVQPPAFVARHGLPDSTPVVLRLVREHARELEAQGQSWHEAIDAVRDAAGELWRGLPTAEKLRFLRHVKPYYDAHRFRIAPQTRDILTAAEQRGQLRFEAGRVLDASRCEEDINVVVRPRGRTSTHQHRCGVVLNCAGLSARVEDWRNPLVQSCLQQGLVRPGELGQGFEINEGSRVVTASGVNVQLYALGSTTLDSFGETPAAVFILRQILRMLPVFLRSG